MTDGLRATLEAEVVRFTLLAAAAAKGEARLLALGWATVDLERASATLAEALPGAGPFIDAQPTAALGGRCLVGPSGLRAVPTLVLLEPSTEGRLAAALARFGEGPLAAWFEVPVGQSALSPSVPLGRALTGPLGPERLLSGEPVHGPHLLVLGGPAGTIGR